VALGLARQAVPETAGRISMGRVVHIPDEADQRSGVMSITIPG
jgi:hypothetical protein